MENPPVLLFDGVCNLCNGAVHFIVKHENNNKIFFAALQSAEAKKLLTSFGDKSEKYESLVFIENNKIYLFSEAAFRITRYLKAPYKWMIVFQILPSFITNGVYKFIAKYRYRFFGRKEECMVPDEKIESRFL